MSMDLKQFMAAEPDTDNMAIRALWWHAKGDWDKAHKLVQQQSTADNNWVHAYLHRVEGDLPNAGHWYQRAKKPVCDSGFKEEWKTILTALLGA